MKRRSEHEHGEAPGQDSFLDVVCNLVGVLIILVMVVGSQASKKAVDKIRAKVAEKVEPVESADPLPNVGAAAKSVADLEREIAQTQAKIVRESQEAAIRKRERDQAQLYVSAANAQLEMAKSKLSQQDRDDFDLKTKTQNALRDLAQLEEAISETRQDDKKPVEVLKHYPTPIAKTVFGKEVHFRLSDGRLTYVPFEEFVERLKTDVPRHVWKLKQADNFTEVIGPLDGFRMRYTLRKEETMVAVSGGRVKQEKAVLDNFVLIPLNDELGESIDSALGKDSDFRFRLSQVNPQQFTVTLWVYPESFEHFRKVREAIMQQGFVCAGRPMPAGHPIGGSPDGSRSAAQ